MSVLTVALRTSKDPIARYRVIWFTVAFAVSFTLTAIGAGYAFAGNGAINNPNIFKYVTVLPGGLHTHGWILFILSIGNFWSTAALTQIYSKLAYTIGRITGIGILFYSMFTAGGLFSAIWFGGQHYNGIMWWYFMAAILSTAKVALPPPFRGQPESDRPHMITGS